MSKLRDIQYFVHKHYEAIKLVLISIILVLVSVVLSSIWANEAYRKAEDARQSEIRDQQLIDLAKEISKDQKKQHNHQDERIACFFNLFVDYTNNKQPISDEDAQSCRSIETTPRPTAQPEPAAQPVPPATAPKETQSEQATDNPKTTTEPEEKNLLDTLVDNVIDAFRR